MIREYKGTFPTLYSSIILCSYQNSILIIYYDSTRLSNSVSWLPPCSISGKSSYNRYCIVRLSLKSVMCTFIILCHVSKYCGNLNYYFPSSQNAYATVAAEYHIAELNNNIICFDVYNLMSCKIYQNYY